MLLNTGDFWSSHRCYYVHVFAFFSLAMEQTGSESAQEQQASKLYYAHMSSFSFGEQSRQV